MTEDLATVNKKRSNKIPIQSDEDVWHFDIEFGTGTAIGCIKYALVIVSTCIRYTYIFVLKDIKDTTILLPMKQFVSQLGRKSSRIISDRDFKLIGGIVSDYLGLYDNNINTTPTTQLAGAPVSRQNQNGIVECKWKNFMNMARNWLASNLLPTSFWFFAIQYAVQVYNYMPVKLDNN